MIEETLAGLVERFNTHAAQNPSLKAELKGIHRVIAIKLTDAGSYAVELKDGALTGLRSGPTGKADVTITTDQKTFLGLLNKEIGPMKALVTRQLTIDGTLEDKLLFRKLL